MADLLLDTKLDPGQYEFVEIIRTCADSLMNIINDVLDFFATSVSVDGWAASAAVPTSAASASAARCPDFLTSS
jgi:hypothetical protein